MTPEAKARQTIDAQLTAAGWHVCSDAGIHDAQPVAIHEFPFNFVFDFAAYMLVGKAHIALHIA